MSDIYTFKNTGKPVYGARPVVHSPNWRRYSAALEALVGHRELEVGPYTDVQSGINSMATAITIIAERLKALEDDRNK